MPTLHEPGTPAAVRRERLVPLVEYALMAPSSHNTQPWKFALAEGEVRLFVDRARWLRIADPDQRELYVSAGCALENLLIAAEHFGLEARVSYAAEERADGLAAVVRISEGGTPGAARAALFDVLDRRHTNRRPYDGRPLPEPVVARLQAAVEDEGVQLWLVTDIETSRRLRDLLTLADSRQLGDPAYRRERADWIGRGSFGDTWLRAKLGRFIVKHVDIGRATARKDAVLMGSASALGLLTSVGNDAGFRLRVGQAYERLALTASTLGLSVQPMSAVLELPLTRAAVAELVPEKVFPQHVFRLGYAEPERRRTSRRTLDDVLAPAGGEFDS